MAESVHEDTFLDSLAWLIDQVPSGGWGWIKDLAQGALKPFRGDAVNEEDELYAMILDQAYNVGFELVRDRTRTLPSCLQSRGEPHQTQKLAPDL